MRLSSYTLPYILQLMEDRKDKEPLLSKGS